MVLYIVFSPHVPLNLANNIDMAIKGCAPERSNQLRNRDAMQIVEESLDDGYCDITGRIGDSDLDLVGTCSCCCVHFLIPSRPKIDRSSGWCEGFRGAR